MTTRPVDELLAPFPPERIWLLPAPHLSGASKVRSARSFPPPASARSRAQLAAEPLPGSRRPPRDAIVPVRSPACLGIRPRRCGRHPL
jgi:hypothetical protein